MPFDWLISRLDIAKERNWDLSRETYQIERQRGEGGERLEKKKKITQEIGDNYKRCNLCLIGISDSKKKKEESKEYLK